MILNNITQYKHYDFESISPDALIKLKSIQSQQSKIFPPDALQRLLYKLEFYLQITNQTLSMDDLDNGLFSTIYLKFLGALNSKKLAPQSRGTAYSDSLIWSDTLKRLKLEFPKIETPIIKTSIVKNTLPIRKLVSAFDAEILDEKKLRIWNGWISKNRKGQSVGLPLYPIYKRLGFEFTDRLFNECHCWISARKIATPPLVGPLSRFISTYPTAISPSCFLNSIFMASFWREFVVFLYTEAHGKGNDLLFVSNSWVQAINFIEKHLIPSGLIAKTSGPLPKPHTGLSNRRETNIVSNNDGKLIHKKLLTEVPLEITDENTITLLFLKIESDLDTVVAWAEWATKELWQRYTRRSVLALQGTPRIIGKPYVTNGSRWLTDPNNPDCLANAAATLAHYGFGLRNFTERTVLYPKPFAQTAKELGLPVSDALFPHCVILVKNHPEITASFLEELELYDKHGKLTGFVKTDGGYKLVGHKDRRGSALAQQIISLNETTTEIINQIISITSILREHLKNQKNDDWRFLLLSCAQAFGAPCRIKYISKLHTKNNIIGELEQFSNRSTEENSKLASQLSIAAVRATAGTMVFFRTLSVSKMSKALGHAEYSHNLLRRYLPEIILNFFQERWIRIFQTGIIVEAMKDSVNILQACSFSDMDQLHTFLCSHALPENLSKEISPHVSPNRFDSKERKSEFLIGVNEDILTALISLQKSEELLCDKSDPRVTYWSEFSKHLTHYIENSLPRRSDITSYLTAARERAKPLLIPGVSLES